MCVFHLMLLDLGYWNCLHILLYALCYISSWTSPLNYFCNFFPYIWIMCHSCSYQFIGGLLSCLCLWVNNQICPASKDYSFGLKLPLCFFTIFAYIISVLQDMRSVAKLLQISNSVIPIFNLSLIWFVSSCSSVAAVRSCSNFFRCSYSLCWWFGRSNSRCSRLLQVLFNWICSFMITKWCYCNHRIKDRKLYKRLDIFYFFLCKFSPF